MNKDSIFEPSNLSNKSLAQQSNELVKLKLRLNKEYLDLAKKTSLETHEMKNRKRELDSLDEEIELIGKKIENKIYKIMKKNELAKNDEIFVLFNNDSIVVDGLTFVSDIELQKMRDFIGYKRFALQPYNYGISIYFSDSWELTE
jgi:hypothetical protein